MQVDESEWRSFDLALLLPSQDLRSVYLEVLLLEEQHVRPRLIIQISGGQRGDEEQRE